MTDLLVPYTTLAWLNITVRTIVRMLSPTSGRPSSADLSTRRLLMVSLLPWLITKSIVRPFCNMNRLSDLITITQLPIMALVLPTSGEEIKGIIL